MIPVNDDKRMGPQKFFQFFTEFFSKVQKNMPRKNATATERARMEAFIDN